MKNVIAGGGLAAVRAAEAMRTAGFDGEVVILGAEPYLPYSRPELSKGFLRGESSRGALYLEKQAFFDEWRIDVRPGRRVAALRPQQRELLLADGSTEDFDQLLIATGSEPRRLDVPGGRLPGVHSLRTVDDAEKLRAALELAQRVVVIGAGLIGLEVAAVARTAGKTVTVIESAHAPLQRVLGGVWGAAVTSLHRAHGVELRLATRVVRIDGDVQVEGVVLSDGSRLPADLVLVCVGVVAADGWLAGSGVELRDGIVVDEHGRTNVPGVFAAGEVAAVEVPVLGRRMRVEQYGNTQAHAVAVGKTMAGRPTRFVAAPGASSEQFGVRLQVLGALPDGLPSVVRGSVARHRFIALFLDEAGRASGAFAMGAPKQALAARRLIASAAVVGVAALEELKVDLDPGSFSPASSLAG